MTDWCILRTSGPRTLKLAASLNAAGVEAWTPTFRFKRRIPRRQATVDLTMAMLPTFVFVRATHLLDLWRILRLPSRDHPPFSIFQQDRRAALVRDAQLGAVRAAEERAAERDRIAARKANAPTFSQGDRVKVDQLAFTGMVGEVIGIKGKAAVVNFGSGIAMTIDSWRLLPDGVSAQSVQSMDTAA